MDSDNVPSPEENVKAEDSQNNEQSYEANKDDSNAAETNETGSDGHKLTIDAKKGDNEPGAVLEDNLAQVESTGGGAGEQGEVKDEVKQQDVKQEQQQQEQQQQEQQQDDKQQEQEQAQQQQQQDVKQQEQQQSYKQQEQQQQQQQEQAQQQDDKQQEGDNSTDGVKSSGSTINDSNGAEANQTADSRVDKPIAEELLVNMSATDAIKPIETDGGEQQKRLLDTETTKTDQRQPEEEAPPEEERPGSVSPPTDPKPSAETQSAQQESAKSQEKPTPQRPAKQTERGEESPHPAYTPDTQPTQQIGLIIVAVLVAVLAMVLFQYLRQSPEPARPTLNRTEVLQQELLKVKQSFHNQRGELWRRSSIHLQRHVKSAKPNEPVSLILAGGLRAEKTLGCLAARLAEAFSTAYNGSVQQLYGTQLANVEHDQAKLVLDTKLKEGFEGDKPAAVIHRLEELPPSSSLIFYRYCDHENAAYKHPLLAFTVLLPLDTVGPDVSLPQVEELVHSHIHRKFLTPDQPDTFDKMDVDKLSGLWSRISHLILPVDMEEHIEKRGCERN